MTSSLQSFYLCVLKRGGSFENLDNILRDWAKDTVQKSLAEALNRIEKQEEEKLSRFRVENDPVEILE